MTFRVTQKMVYADGVVCTVEQTVSSREEAVAIARCLGAPMDAPYEMTSDKVCVSVAVTYDTCDVVTRIVEL